MSEPIFVAAIKALEPVLDELVVIGGTAYRLFEEHPWVDASVPVGLTTEDVDIAVPARNLWRAKLGERLVEGLRRNGFEAELPHGPNSARVYDYMGAVESASYVQFVAPLGPPGRRPALFGGLEVDELRHLELLRLDPWSVHVPGVDRSLKVACPAAFLVHKLLVIDHRSKGEAAAKDLAYLWGCLRRFAGAAYEIGAAVERLELSSKHLDKLGVNLQQYVREDSREALLAARIASLSEGPVTCAALVGAIRFGMAKVIVGLGAS